MRRPGHRSKFITTTLQTLQNLIKLSPSPAAATLLPSALFATNIPHFEDPPRGRAGPTSSPFVRSHTLTVASHAPLNAATPFPDTLTLITAAVWPESSKRRYHWVPYLFHTLTTFPTAAVTTDPSEERDTETTLEEGVGLEVAAPAEAEGFISCTTIGGDPGGLGSGEGAGAEISYRIKPPSDVPTASMEPSEETDRQRIEEPTLRPD